MEVRFTDIADYLRDTTSPDKYLTEKSLKGFIFQNLRLSINDQEKVMPIVNAYFFEK